MRSAVASAQEPTVDPCQAAADALQDFGLVVKVADTSGRIQRVPYVDDRPGTKNGWYVLTAFTAREGGEPVEVVCGWAGWWKMDQRQRILATSRSLSRLEKAQVSSRQRELEEQAQRARADLARQTAVRAAKIWAALPTEGPSEYLARKKIPGLGARFTRGTVVVPVGDGETLTGLQFISSDGSKKLLTGSVVTGNYCLIGDPPGPGDWLGIAEGYATSISCHLAGAMTVACAFNAGNLDAVAKKLKDRYPWARFALLSDDDWLTTGNPGATKASQAAKRVRGVVATPVFPEGLERGTDWNDLWVAVGKEETGAQLRAALVAATEATGPRGDDPPIPAPEAAWGSEEPVLPDNVVQGYFPGSVLASRLLRSDKGAVASKSFNVRLVLEHDPAWSGVLGWCEFSARIMKRRHPPFERGCVGEWMDADDADLRFWLAGRYQIEPKGQDLGDAVLGAARARPYHPVLEYLDGLEWDGTERLAGWLMDLLGARTPDQDEEGSAQRAQRYLERVGVMTLIQAVARVRDPGCKADTVLILEGEQGRRKSTALKTLFGEDWFSDTPIDLGSKDAYENIRGLWCIEMAELDALNKADSTRAKAFFSSATDRYRVSYGRRAQTFPRQCVVAGTTNQHQYLRDSTGNRRYWPVLCERIDIESLAACRDHLWAEADWRYRQGETWWPSEEERELFHEQQEFRSEIDAWEPLVLSYLQKRLDEVFGQEDQLLVTAAEVMKDGLQLDPANMRRPEQTRLGILMQRLGWRHRRGYGPGGARPYGYRPPLNWGRGGTHGPAF